MTDRNLFDTLCFNQVNISSSYIDLTDDIEESDEDEEIVFPDSFSSSVGKILNEKSISAVLSNMELFYKSEIEYLEDDRYDRENLNQKNFNLSYFEEDLHVNNISENVDFSNKIENKSSEKNSSKQMFSSYYFIKQTFNCPVVLIDHLIDTMYDMSLKGEDDDIEMECPKHIEIDAAFDTNKSNVITKRDLRLLNFYQAPKPKKSRPSNVVRTLKSKQLISTSPPPLEDKKLLQLELSSPIEIIEISDSDEDNEMMESDNNNGTSKKIQKIVGC